MEYFCFQLEREVITNYKYTHSKLHHLLNTVPNQKSFSAYASTGYRSTNGMYGFVNNPNPRMPVTLLLDTSYSMDKEPIARLNSGVSLFLDSLREDELTRHSVETSIISFNSTVECKNDFALVDEISFQSLKASGNTCMGEGLMAAIHHLEKRKAKYKSAGIDYYQPMLIVMSDGQANGDKKVLEEAIAQIDLLKKQRKLTVVAIGIDNSQEIDAVMRQMRRLGEEKTFRLHDFQFRDFFVWLSQSVSNFSASIPGDEPNLDLDALKQLESQPWPDNLL